MQTATLRAATEQLGISLEDIVQYHKKGKKAIIEIDLKHPHAESEKKSEADVFDNIVAMSEDIGIKDWSLNHDHYLYGVPKRNDGEPHV